MMRTSFFGDSYDIVKHSLIAWLQPMGKWAIHPMFTEKVSPEFARDFSDLLDAPLVSTDVLELETDRDAYFACCTTYSHLLLDPNTGLRFRSNQNELSPDHLFGSDLLSIVNHRSGALTIVFDQALARGRERGDLAMKLERLHSEGLHGFAYHSHACFIFVAREPATAQHALDLLSGRGRLPVRRFVSAPQG